MKLTRAQLAKAGVKSSAKPSKYRAVRTTVNGIEFASKKEAERYWVLYRAAKAGMIQELQLQVPFVLWSGDVHWRLDEREKTLFIYLADFVYYKNGVRHVEDVKGFRTPVYRLKKRIIEAKYGIVIEEV